jgi:protein-tyrosine phosphatase
VRVLVVCTANICRSPFGAAVLAHRLAAPAIELVSAGTQATSGRVADPVMVEAALERGYRDLSAHRSQPVLAGLLRSCDLVLCMERGHRDDLLNRYPMMTGRIRTFLETPSRDVDDPTGLTPADYARAIAVIEDGALVWAERIRRIGPV